MILVFGPWLSGLPCSLQGSYNFWASTTKFERRRDYSRSEERENVLNGRWAAERNRRDIQSEMK